MRLRENYVLHDRGLEAYKQLACFDVAEIGLGAVVLNIGGGFSQRFERELVTIRPDIKILTVDPSLVRGRVFYVGDGRREEYESYYLDDSEVKKRRVAVGQYARTVAGIGQSLPFAPGCVDYAVDVYGPAYYLNASLKGYFREVARVLRVGGKFHITAVWWGMEETSRVELKNAGFVEILPFDRGVGNRSGIIATR